MGEDMSRAKFEIERRSNLSYEDFAREYLYPMKPVIVTDVLQKWPAMTRWTPEFFKHEFSSVKFTINDSTYGRASFKNGKEVEFTMAEFIDRVLESTEENPAPYFRNRNPVPILSDIEARHSANSAISSTKLAE